MVGTSAAPELPGYRDLTPLGRGGHSDVYRAYQEQFDRWVAVKLLTVTFEHDGARRRFLRECQVAGRVSSHPHIVTVYDAGSSPDGRPYIAMELYDGGSVADRVQARGPLPLDEALRIAVALAGAVETAHRSGVVHRDVKPSNVLLTTYGQPALADFGLSLAAERQEVTAGTDALSPYHAPPEVLDGAGPAPISDVYSLASTAYTMLAGRPPHQVEEGEPLAGLLTRIVEADAPPTGRADVPPSLEAALGAALARDPGARTPSALAFAQAIQQVQAELGLEITQPVVLDVPPGSDPAPGTSRPPAVATGAVAGPEDGRADPAAAPGAAVTAAGAPAGSPPPDAEETVHRSRTQWPPAPVTGEAPSRSRRAPLAVAAVLVVAAGGAVAALAATGGDEPGSSATSTETSEPATTATTRETGTSATATTREPTTSTTEATTSTTGATTTTSGTPVDLPVAQVAAPSTADDGADGCGRSVSYAAANLTDGDVGTAWRMEGDGSGEWLTIVLGGEHRVRAVGLVPGHAGVDGCDGTDRFAGSRRPTSVTWRFEDGTEARQTLRDVAEMQTVDVDARSRVVRVRIDGVTSAPRRDVTAVSEILVRGM